MNQEGRITAQESRHLYNEERELLALAETDDQVDYVLTEIENDSRYEVARAIRGKLSRFAGALEYKILDAQTRPDPVAVTPEAPTPVPENYDDLLEEVEEREDQAEYYENRQRDIMFIHTVVEDHAARLADAGKNPTRKQREAIERALKQSVREFNASAMLAEPHRLMVMLESIIAKQDTSSEACQDVSKLLSEKVRVLVEARSRGETTPDDIAGWLRVAAHPGIAQRELQQTLLAAHFRPLLGSSSEKTIDHYETFVRSLLRLSDEPNALELGLSIAEFKNQAIFGKSDIYQTYIDVYPQAGLHRPDMVGRLINIKRALLEIDFAAHKEALDDLIDSAATDLEKLQPQKPLQEMLHDVPSDMQQDFTNRYLQGKLSHSEAIRVAIMTEAMKEIGLSEFSRRFEVLQQSQQFIEHAWESSDDYMDFAMGERDGRLIDYILAQAKAKFPEQADFLSQVLSHSSAVREDIDTYLNDRTLDLGKQFTERLRQNGGTLPAAMMDSDYFLGLQRKEINLGDGYILTIAGENENDIAEQEAYISALDPAVLEAEKQRFDERSRGMYSRNHVLETGNDEYGFFGFMRRETVEDLKAIHPLEQLLADSRVEKALNIDHDPHEIIEKLRDQVLLNRRRFMNIRGIAAHFTQDERNDSSIRLELKKHPKNPQAFIGRLMVAGHRPAKFLLDPNLLIQTGNKRVQNKERLAVLNAASAAVLYTFMCQEAVESEEGTIGEGKSAVTERIAHLRLLPEGAKHSYEAWSNCLEAEGLDLEVLSRNAQIEKQTTRVSTYVKAIEGDSETKPPLLIYLNPES